MKPSIGLQRSTKYFGRKMAHADACLLALQHLKDMGLGLVGYEARCTTRYGVDLSVEAYVGSAEHNEIADYCWHDPWTDIDYGRDPFGNYIRIKFYGLEAVERFLMNHNHRRAA